jgi:hypothetical protein
MYDVRLIVPRLDMDYCPSNLRMLSYLRLIDDMKGCMFTYLCALAGGKGGSTFDIFTAHDDMHVP